MSPGSFEVPAEAAGSVDEKRERLAGRPPLPETPAAAAIESSLRYVWACSAFVADACLRDAGLLPWLATDGRLLEDLECDAYLAGVGTPAAPP